MPDQREPRGLLALMLLHDSRTETRTSESGDLVLLEEQDRTRWNRAQIEEALPLVELALRGTGARPYAVQAAIAALHARAAVAADTDWAQIAALYGVLYAQLPSPVVALNRAVAVAFSRGLAAGLALIEALRAELDGFQPFHAARADLLRRLGRPADAAAAYRRAIAMTSNDVERRYLQRRLDEIAGGSTNTTRSP
jgi:RNA polymerase sigma-70 factor (ECF subfamily)